MKKRYEVFVSSTFNDLQAERQEVIQALLELNCIPAGMELFPAANDDQWTLIKRVIDNCDYYLVIIAGRYGSLGPNGVGYTEAEYRYAIEKRKPVMGFLHKDPGNIQASLVESVPELRERLVNFRELVKQKPCRFWESSAELGSLVSRSLVRIIEDQPAIGWVRADLVPDDSAAAEILRLNQQIEQLKQQLEITRVQAPPGTEELAQGDDRISIHCNCKAHFSVFQGEISFDATIGTTWFSVFRALSPLMIHESAEASLRSALDSWLLEVGSPTLEAQARLEGRKLYHVTATVEDFHTIKVQLRALGLITKSVKARSVKDTETYWTLTPYGDTVMTRLRAIRRQVGHLSAAEIDAMLFPESEKQD